MSSTSIGIVWSQIDGRFISDSEGQLKIAKNVEAVASGIEEILKTRKGERVMLPSFGSVLPDILFEPLDGTAIKILSRTVKEEIEMWDNRVFVESVELYSDPDRSSLSVTILFQIRGYTEIFKLDTVINGEL